MSVPRNRRDIEIIDQVSRWAILTLPATPEVYAKKAQEEWDEFVAEPSVEEAVDVILCLAAFIRKSGVLPSRAIEVKHEVNKDRRWVKQPDGTYQHIERAVDKDLGKKSLNNDGFTK